MDTIVTPWITIVGMVISIAISILSAWASLRKTNSEVENNNVEKNKTNAEIVNIYASELRKIKEDQIRDQSINKEKIDELKEEVACLVERLEKEGKERDEERKMYREFIAELLLGITKLTGQIQIRGENPVWTPPCLDLLEKDGAE